MSEGESDYWRFGLIERLWLSVLLFIQWPIVLTVSEAVIYEHGEMTAEAAQAFEFMFWMGVVMIVLAMFGGPAIRSLPAVYTRIRQKVTS